MFYKGMRSKVRCCPAQCCVCVWVCMYLRMSVYIWMDGWMDVYVCVCVRGYT
jgi:hypothetical protein